MCQTLYSKCIATKLLQSSPTVQPHRRQPIRLLCPWDSPGKNTGVGCPFLLQGMHACSVTSVMPNSVRPYGQQPTRLLCPQDSPGKNTRVGCHFLLQFYSWVSGTHKSSSSVFYKLLLFISHLSSVVFLYYKLSKGNLQRLKMFIQ